MKKRIQLTAASLSILLVGAVCAPTAPDNGATTDFQATLTGDAERPDPIQTAASGTGTFTLNADETQLTFNITASGFTEDVTAAHFHLSDDGPNGSGGVVFAIETLTNDGNGGASAQGTWDLAAEDVTNLRNGNIYVNFHTKTNQPGEIRGNLVPAS